MPSFYEFFAGGGMVRAGLGSGWQCLFANDFDHKKGRIYERNWGGSALKVADVKSLTLGNLPSSADLIWGSFPCQDLSLAGGGAGLKGERSGTFWPFWGLVRGLQGEGRTPKLIVLENVLGTLTSHRGKDFTAICGALQRSSYRFGAIVVDAALFVPQSRPRLFIIGVHESITLPPSSFDAFPSELWHPRALRTAVAKLGPKSRENWVWWNMPAPSSRTLTFENFVEQAPRDVEWRSTDETHRLLGMMSELNRKKVDYAKSLGRLVVGCVYKRTRRDEYGRKIQRAEVRFDDVAGCLRTPAGGSSRQLLLVVESNAVKSRLISSRETARLMGLPDTYMLPENYNEAYHLTGDGVVVPVVRYLAAHIFEPILEIGDVTTRIAA